MSKNYLNLQQQRDFGDVFNATFIFLKQNFGRILKTFLIYVAPFALLYGICMAISSYSMLTSVGTQNSMNPFANFGWPMLLGYLFMILSYTFLYGIVLEYIKLYKEQGPDFPLSWMGKRLLRDFWKILLTGFVIMFLTILGTIVLIIPGIYLMICFSIVLPIQILENQSLGESLSRCFYLIKSNWWATFLILFIIGLVAYVLQMAFGLPAGIYQIIATFHMAQGESMELNQPLLILLYTISSVGSIFLQTLPIIGITFQYFNLVEKKESPNLLKELETIGRNV